MRIRLKRGDERGFLFYNELAIGKINYKIETESERMKRDLDEYFNQRKEFKIPETDEIDDYRTDVVKPIEDSMYFDLSLCSLWNALGIWVEWPKEKEV